MYQNQRWKGVSVTLRARTVFKIFFLNVGKFPVPVIPMG